RRILEILINLRVSELRDHAPRRVRMEEERLAVRIDQVPPARVNREREPRRRLISATYARRKRRERSLYPPIAANRNTELAPERRAHPAERAKYPAVKARRRFHLSYQRRGQGTENALDPTDPRI